jgi:hypothetical protein
MIAATTDQHLITLAVLDYFEGWFDADVERMDRALHDGLVKRQAGDELGITTKARMLELTAEGAGREDGEDPRVDVQIDDMCEDVAAVTVRSAVYHEYLHLVRTTKGWKIANALWRPR